MGADGAHGVPTSAKASDGTLSLKDGANAIRVISRILRQAWLGWRAIPSTNLSLLCGFMAENALFSLLIQYFNNDNGNF